jgi:hypothetical protein
MRKIFLTVSIILSISFILLLLIRFTETESFGMGGRVDNNQINENIVTDINNDLNFLFNELDSIKSTVEDKQYSITNRLNYLKALSTKSPEDFIENYEISELNPSQTALDALKSCNTEDGYWILIPDYILDAFYNAGEISWPDRLEEWSVDLKKYTVELRKYTSVLKGQPTPILSAECLDSSEPLSTVESVPSSTYEAPFRCVRIKK